MNRFRLLLFTTFVAAVTVLISGISVTYAEQAPATAKQTTAQAAAAQKADAAVKARAQRDAAIKRRHEAKKYIQSVIEGQQTGPATAAPVNAGKEGAK